MFSMLRTPHPPTGVEHSIYANFYGYGENSLLVAGANLLRVFRLVPAELITSGTPSQGQNTKPPKMKLECLATFKLHGCVMGMQKVTLPGAMRDILVMSFSEAKLSILEYDPETNELKTLSLHIFEDDDMRQGYVHNHWIPFVRTDPDNRCAAMLVFGQKIIILPFRGDVSNNITTEDSNLSSHPSSERTNQGRAPVLASYALDLKAINQTNEVTNIIDIQFLHGYNQPTLLILYEPLRTFAGRIAVRKDTCRVDVFTLDVKEKISAFIWSRESLPFDSVQALPVPQPIGGTLVFGANSLFYINQGIPSYGVSLNSKGDQTTENVIKPQEGVCITLDCAQAQFLSFDRAVISLKGGELYVLSLLLDGLRSVRGFHFDRAAASVLTTSLAVCEDNYLFLGSRIGNSLLLQFTEKDIGNLYGPGSRKGDKQPPVKKKRIDTVGDWMSPDVFDLEVYGQDDAPTSQKITSYTFEVCDSILNIGPCGQVCIGEPAFLSEEFLPASKADPNVELVSTSGHGKNGALCVLQQTIKPQVVTTFELPGCLDMWTVVGDAKSDPSKGGHAFLILSRSDSTMILQTGEEINELAQSGFVTQAPTIFTGNLGTNKFIVQVTQRDVRLLSGSEEIETKMFDGDSLIVYATSADPYIVALNQDGELFLISFSEAGTNPSLKISRVGLSPSSKVLAVSAYKDVSGLFTTEKPDIVVTTSTIEESRNTTVDTVEDEDDLLYGEAAPSLFSEAAAALTEPVKAKTSNFERAWKKYQKPRVPTFWTFCLRENGNLEIYSIPNFTLQFVIEMFPLAPDILTDSLHGQYNKPLISMNSLPEFLPSDSVPTVVEIMVVGLGNDNRRPVLLARTSDHELFVYEAFPYYERTKDEQLKMRFKKLKHGMILRERKGKTRRHAEKPSWHRSQMRHFKNIAGYEGVFICGPYPYWLILTSRGELRTHPMSIDWSVPCFAAFNNVNCPQGFIYINRKAELRICVLPTHLSYDAPWPVRKVPLRCTPHFITYHLESKTYTVVTSVSEPTTKVWKFNGDDKELCVEERDERFPWPDADTFYLQLFSPISWEPIPGTKIQLDDWERATCLKHLYLSSEGMHSGQRGYVVCGTAYCYGEDITPRGYVRIYDIIEVIPEPGQPLTKNKIKSVYEKEQKGAITAVAAVSGFLVAAVGQKVYVFELKNKELYGLAFIDSQIYIHQLVSLKNFILVGDAMNSIDLLMYQQDYRTLAVVSKDSRKLEVFSVEYMVDGTSLAFVVSDADKNLIIYSHQPDSRDSQKLARRADIHVGQHINTMFRVRAKITDPSTGGRVLTGLDKRHVLWFATLDGALGHVIPCNEKTYRRLLMLQNVLATDIHHNAGLNPKGYRLLRQRRRELVNPCKGIIDGDLVRVFTDLPLLQKAEIAKRIGSKYTDLLDEIAELDRMAAHF